MIAEGRRTVRAARGLLQGAAGKQWLLTQQQSAGTLGGEPAPGSPARAWALLWWVPCRLCHRGHLIVITLQQHAVQLLRPESCCQQASHGAWDEVGCTSCRPRGPLIVQTLVQLVWLLSLQCWLTCWVRLTERWSWRGLGQGLLALVHSTLIH